MNVVTIIYSNFDVHEGIVNDPEAEFIGGE